ncbi:MAG: xanthine dehydrogenase family protein subunit M [Chloroflexi bacterium]|nr:xanthine dehydrogenase family protein subunit M [Chloroflexota bacterium]
MKRFEYYEPRSVGEATTLLSTLVGDVAVLAGGTDLLNQMKREELSPNSLINLKSITGLSYIHLDGSRSVRIGALTRIADLATNEPLRCAFPAIVDAARSLGLPSVRNRATIGGNLCHASPAADMAPALIAYGAEVKVVGPQGHRRLPVESFFVGPGRNALGKGEILTEIAVDTPDLSGRSVYFKHSIRKANDTAIVGVAAYAAIDPRSGCVAAIGLGLGAVSPTPVRARLAEAAIRGKKADTPLINEAANIASGECQPIGDIRGSAAYRTEMVRVFARRALEAVL